MLRTRYVLGLLLAACNWGSGTAWVAQPVTAEEERPFDPNALPANGAGRGAQPRGQMASRTLSAASARPDAADVRGRSLGTFRNTYYDFPSEAEFSGEKVRLMNAACARIALVPRAFHDAVCVQGSGSLARGGTVSFAKRDCACAEVCPRTGQRICFDELDAAQFPWGRGAVGKAITPLRTVAADTQVLPMGTPIYIPEFDGMPLDESGNELHDGCFVVEDRGVRVTGSHVDVFTGHTGNTAALNERVPTNQGVTVVVDAPRCERLRAN